MQDAAEVRFRPMQRDHYELLSGWLEQPHIARWWNIDPSLDSIEAKYGPRIDGLQPAAMWVVELDGVPGGLIQSYRHADYPEHDEVVDIPEAVGIDYLLAAEFAGRGLGPGIVRQFADLVFEHYPAADCCVAIPAQENRRSWRCLEIAGFTRVRECQPPGDPPAFAYALDRQA